MDERLQRLLEVAFPVTTDSQVIRGVSEGIALADDLIENNRILRTGAGNDLRGHIRRAGIMFRLHDLCVQNELPFMAEIVPMPHGPWHWLEIRSGNFLAHVCRTSAPHAFPEETLSRQDARLRNQDDMFAPRVADRGELIVSIREFYTWLTFGIGQQGVLEHLVWAMPPADDGDWLAYRDVLHHAIATTPLQPDQAPAQESRAEPPTEGLNLRFQEHIEQSLSKQNKKDDEENDKE
jgi:hypothetical protein